MMMTDKDLKFSQQIKLTTKYSPSLQGNDNVVGWGCTGLVENTSAKQL